jgi:hypothetical protein
MADRRRDRRGRLVAMPKPPPLDPELVKRLSDGIPPAYQPWQPQQWRLVIHSKTRETRQEES